MSADWQKISEERAMLIIARDALEAAVVRFERASVGTSVYLAFASATEVLWWACALDERLDNMDASYRQRRDGDQNGRLLAGVRWARNRAGHQLGMVLAEHHGSELGKMILGLAVLGTRSAITWADASKVPAGRHDRGRDVYERHMQGRDVATTVAALRMWFHGAAGSESTLNFGPPRRSKS